MAGRNTNTELDSKKSGISSRKQNSKEKRDKCKASKILQYRNFFFTFQPENLLLLNSFHNKRIRDFVLASQT